MADTTLGTAVLRTRLDNTGLKAGLSSAQSESTRVLTGIDQRLSSLGAKWTKLGIGLTVGVTAPIIAMGVASIKAASDLEETVSKFSVVFSSVGDAAEASAKRLSDSFGLSTRAAKALLSDTGDLLTGFGFTGAAALDLSTQVNELAVDLASFTNFSGGAEGASAALTKALLGERESVKSLGISILETDVQAKVLLNTQNGVTFASERQAKAYATLQIAQEQSKNAIGDFSRTSGSFANQMRILKGEVENLSGALGTGLLPIVTPLITKLADAAGRFADMSEGTRSAILVFAGLAAAAGPLLIALGGITTALPKIITGFTTLRTVAAPLFGPGGLILVGAAAFAALAAKTIDATNALNEYANAGIQVQGLTDEAAGIMDAILTLEEARRDFVMNQAEQIADGVIDLEEARARVGRYNDQIQALRDQFNGLVRDAAKVRDATSGIADLDVNVNVTGLEDLLAIPAAVDDAVEATRRLAGGIAALGDTTFTPTQVAAGGEHLGAVERQARLDTTLGQLAVNAQNAADAVAIYADTQRAMGDAEAIRVTETLDQWGELQRVSIAAITDIEKHRVNLDDPGVLLTGATPTVLVPPEVQAIIPAGVSLVTALEGITANLGDMTSASIAQVRGRINEFEELQSQATSAEARGQLGLLIAALKDELVEMMRRATPVALTSAATVSFGLTARDRQFNEGLTPFQRRPEGEGDLDAAADANKAREVQLAAAEQFKSTIISAGLSFTQTLVDGIRSGDLGSVVKGGLGAAGSILGAIPGIGTIATIFAGLLPIIGSLFGGGNRRDELESVRAAGAATRGAPAIEFNVIVNQALSIQSLTDPASRGAINGLLDQTVRRLEDAITRNIIPRLQTLEATA